VGAEGRLEWSWRNGAHCCVVEVEPDTGSVDIKRYLAVDDCGVQLNPMLVQGQVHGGVAQGIAEALFEEARYDEDGNLLTGTMTSYMIPGPPELPPFQVHDTVEPHHDNALGVRGIGERGALSRVQMTRGRLRRRRRSSTLWSTRLRTSACATWSALRHPSESGARFRRQRHDLRTVRVRSRRVGRPRDRATRHYRGPEAA